MKDERGKYLQKMDFLCHIIPFCIMVLHIVKKKYFFTAVYARLFMACIDQRTTEMYILIVVCDNRWRPQTRHS